MRAVVRKYDLALRKAKDSGVGKLMYGFISYKSHSLGDLILAHLANISTSNKKQIIIYSIVAYVAISLTLSHLLLYFIYYCHYYSVRAM